MTCFKLLMYGQIKENQLNTTIDYALTYNGFISRKVEEKLIHDLFLSSTFLD
jgi:hypothetical protein